MTNPKKNLPTIIPVSFALTMTGLSEKELQRYIDNGTLEAQQLLNGEVLVNADQAEKLASKQIILEEKFADRIGKGISLSEAAKKYKISRATIETWVYRNDYIKMVNPDSYPKLFDEADIAYCAGVFEDRKLMGITSGGTPLLDEYGLPNLQLKHPKLSQKRRQAKQS